MRGFYKVFSLAIALIIAISLFSLNIYAMDAKSTWPTGIKNAYYADEGNTRNEAWIDKTNRIISIPQGNDFDDGKQNHGVYHFYSDVESGDVYYVHWVVKVQETPDADGAVVFAQDPAYLSTYTEKGKGEVEVETGINGLIEPDTTDVYYEDTTPGKWQVFSYGFEVTNDAAKHVQHRIHFKNVAPIQVKYLVVTDESITSFECDPETGEIDGITNDKAYVTPTPSPTPTPAPTQSIAPSKSPDAEKPAASTPANNNPSPSSSNEPGDNGSLLIIIIIVVAVIVIGGVIAFIVIKKKKS